MATYKNDALLKRNIEGSFNYYDWHKGIGTAGDKGIASRLGGHSYNIISGQDRHEIYMPELRHNEHFVDKKGRHTAHFFGPRRRKFEQDERKLVPDCFTMQADHPREQIVADMRTQKGLAQLENPQSFKAYKERTESMFGTPAPKRHTINDKRYANEIEKFNPKLTSRSQWEQRRGDVMTLSASAPNLSLVNPAQSLGRAVRADARKEASQRLTESAHFAPWQSANTYGVSLEATGAGREHAAAQTHLSVARLENHDFGITRKNNHYSSQDKLTRSDPFFMKPRSGITNNSVKYNLVSNERLWFKY